MLNLRSYYLWGWHGFDRSSFSLWLHVASEGLALDNPQTITANNSNYRPAYALAA